MKTYIEKIYLQSLTLIMALSFLASCVADEPLPTDKELFIQAIAGTWSVDEQSTVILDDQDITSVLLGFEITLDEELNYTSNGSDLLVEILPWPSSGKFLLNDELNEFTRDDGLVIGLELDANDNINFTFQYTENFDNSNGRTKGIRGGWEMKFARKP